MYIGRLKRRALAGACLMAVNIPMILYIYSLLGPTQPINDNDVENFVHSESEDSVEEVVTAPLEQPVLVDCFEPGIVPHPFDKSKFVKCSKVQFGWSKFNQEIFQCQPEYQYQHGLKRCAPIPTAPREGYIVPKYRGDSETKMRRNFVKQMAKDAWDDYVRYSWGSNDLSPISKRGHEGDIFGGVKLGATIIDSLDTFYIMGLDEEFQMAKKFVEQELKFKTGIRVSIFETNIRFVGGLLSAYVMTQEEIFLTKAYEIASLLLPAFDTPTGIPRSCIKINSSGVEGDESVLADFGTLHLEFMYLSKVTGDPVFRDKAVAIRRFLRKKEKHSGLYCNLVEVTKGRCTKNQVSIGALGDSFYEYLLKSAIQLNDPEARQMYDEAMSAFVNNGLLKISPQSNMLYIAEYSSGSVQDTVSHLSCFAGGLLALGASAAPDNLNAPRDFEIGRNFTNTCHEAYIRTATHLGPDVFRFTSTVEAAPLSLMDKVYKLRPEVVESYFVLYRITGDQKYRDWGWDVVLALEKYCKVGPGRGYSGIRDVHWVDTSQDDIQQSFFLAETLKYLYLLFSDKDLLSLDEWVFNTEGHPLPVAATNPLY